MAVMIPEIPNPFQPGSLEDVMFEALKSLPDSCMVFHSFRLTDVKDGILKESETDFIIFDRERGILCLEAKAGAVSFRNGRWMYGNGAPMRSGGPFRQAAANKWKLMELIGNSRLGFLTERIKFLHGVWFPSLSGERIDEIDMPPEADRKIVLGSEALSDTWTCIERLFSLDVPAGIVTDISDGEFRAVVREILCPKFNIFPPPGFDVDLKHAVFHRMLDEQSGILNFLTEQRSAVVNGAAGTGKTMIAVEKAVRHAADGEKVLFLCYNSELKKFLALHYANPLIDFMTLDGYVCRLCGVSVSDYGRAERKLKDFAAFDSFSYDHVVVDEGQDFGRDAIENVKLLQLLHDAVLADPNSKSSCYVFYDRLQAVQSDRIPVFIRNAECRLTLHKNCRNTENICRTAMSLLQERGRSEVLRGIAGKIPCIHFCIEETYFNALDDVIGGLRRDGIDDIVILTLSTETDSIVSGYVRNGVYEECRFMSCRKFKGLEADAVILVDFTERTVTDDAMLFYVGASRARIRLEIMTVMDNESCRNALERTEGVGAGRRPMRDLASMLKCTALVYH